MGNTIYKNIKEYKNGNKEIFREIINVFNPLINKLSKSVNGEDTRQDLLVHLLEKSKNYLNLIQVLLMIMIINNR